MTVLPPYKVNPNDALLVARAAWQRLPDWFEYDGRSSPFKKLAAVLMPYRLTLIRDDAAWIHDGGYGPLRLPGSGLEHVTKEQWDAAYVAMIIYKSRPYRWERWFEMGTRAAAFDASMLSKFGHRAWAQRERKYSAFKDWDEWKAEGDRLNPWASPADPPGTGDAIQPEGNES